MYQNHLSITLKKILINLFFSDDDVDSVTSWKVYSPSGEPVFIK